MTSLFATRRRVEDFARHVESQRPSHDPNLAPLLELVALFRPATVEPSPAFCSALRGQLMAVAAELPAPSGNAPAPEPKPSPSRFSRRRRRRATTAAVATVAVASAMVGVAAAAREALPGEALYPVKTKLEGAQVAVATNPESRGRQYLGSSEHRLAEVHALVSQPKARANDARTVALVESTLRSFTRDARTGGELLVQAHEEERSDAPITRLREFTDSSTDQLTALGPTLPAELRPAYDDAIGALDGLRRDLDQLCLTCLTDGGSAPRPSQRESTDADQPVPTTEQRVQRDRRDRADRNRRDRPDLPLPTNPGPVPPQPGPRDTSPTLELPLPTKLPLPTLLPFPRTTAQPTEPLLLDLPLPWPTALPLPLPVPGLDGGQPLSDSSGDQQAPTPTDDPDGSKASPTPTPDSTDSDDGSSHDGSSDGDGDGDGSGDSDGDSFQLPLFGVELGIR